MSTAERLAASYRRTLDEIVRIRRYAGSGTGRPRHEVAARGKATPYASTELVGGIEQGDQRVVVLASDLIGRGFALPVRDSDKVIVRGRELAIVKPAERKAPDGTVIAYELQVRG